MASPWGDLSSELCAGISWALGRANSVKGKGNGARAWARWTDWAKASVAPLGEEQQRAKLRKGPVARGLAAEFLHAVGLS